MFHYVLYLLMRDVRSTTWYFGHHQHVLSSDKGRNLECWGMATRNFVVDWFDVDFIESEDLLKEYIWILQYKKLNRCRNNVINNGFIWINNVWNDEVFTATPFQECLKICWDRNIIFLIHPRAWLIGFINSIKSILNKAPTELRMAERL